MTSLSPLVRGVLKRRERMQLMAIEAVCDHSHDIKKQSVTVFQTVGARCTGKGGDKVQTRTIRSSKQMISSFMSWSTDGSAAGMMFVPPVSRMVDARSVFLTQARLA